jgi:hypothetical protein
MTNFFYYSVAKLPEEMTQDELVEELRRAYEVGQHAKHSGQGISTKETARRRKCELALVSLPGGIDRWNEIK